MKRLFYFPAWAFLAMLAGSCSKNAPDAGAQQVSNMQNRTLVLGHGGMGIANLYPMDSYESMLNCINLGSDGTELDVQMTRDSVLVAYHDETLETLTDGSGRIIDYTWQELQAFKYRPAPYVEYDIANLDVLFAHLDNLQQLTFSFDNKLYFDASYQPVFMRAVERLLEHYGMEEQVFIESHDVAFLQDFKELQPDYKYFLNPDNFEDGLQQASSNGFYGIIMDDENITAGQIETAHQNGLHVQTWGPVSSDDNREAAAKDPDAIQTNNVSALVDLLK